MRAAVLKPPVFGAVDLDQLANAIAAMPRLVHRLQPLPAVLPNPVHQHPAPHRLNAEMQPMPLRQLLCSKRRTKIHVVSLDQRQCLAPYDRRIGSVARLAALLRQQCRRASDPIGLQQPECLPRCEPKQLRCLSHCNPFRHNIPQHMHPVDLGPAHRQHRHHSKPPGPCLKEVRA